MLGALLPHKHYRFHHCLHCVLGWGPGRGRGGPGGRGGVFRQPLCTSVDSSLMHGTLQLIRQLTVGHAWLMDQWWCGMGDGSMVV